MELRIQIARDLLESCAISPPDYSVVAGALRGGENREDILNRGPQMAGSLPMA